MESNKNRDSTETASVINKQLCINAVERDTRSKSTSRYTDTHWQYLKREKKTDSEYKTRRTIAVYDIIHYSQKWHANENKITSFCHFQFGNRNGISIPDQTIDWKHLWIGGKSLRVFIRLLFGMELDEKTHKHLNQYWCRFQSIGSNLLYLFCHCELFRSQQIEFRSP